MISEDLNKHIHNIQFKYADFTNSTLNALEYDKCSKQDKIDNSRILSSYIRLLWCYEPFAQKVTYASSFKVFRADSDPITITITIGAQAFVYTGSSDAETIVTTLKGLINSTTETPIDYVADCTANTLYIWTYDAAASFADVTTAVITINTNLDNTVTVTNLENNTSEILNLFNCLTSEQLCSVINSAYEILH